MLRAVATNIGRPIFWQRRIEAFAAGECHAKIGPVALQRANLQRPGAQG
jgi:hypothetical protein